MPQGQPDPGPADCRSLGVVTVTYHPDLALLRKQAAEIPAESLYVLVDNASSEECRDTLRALAEARPRTVLVLNERNRGLAAGLNQGVRQALTAEPALSVVLLLDQDTVPGASGIAALLSRWNELRGRDSALGGVGPRLVDSRTGLDHGFHQIKGWRYRRVRPRAGEVAPVPVIGLNGSGTLVRVALWQELEGLDESMFIDHVDTEWSFRVLSNGYSLYGIPSVAFDHKMGHATVRFWFFGWRIWPYRNPERHYYLFRNAIRLLRSDYAPAIWKLWVIPKLVATFLVHLVADPARGAQARAMLSGVRAGFGRGAGGPYPQK